MWGNFLKEYGIVLRDAHLKLPLHGEDLRVRGKVRLGKAPDAVRIMNCEGASWSMHMAYARDSSMHKA